MIKNTFTCSDLELAQQHESDIENQIERYVDGVNNGDYVISITSKGVFIEEQIPYEPNHTLYDVIISDDMGKKLGAIENYFNVLVK